MLAFPSPAMAQSPLLIESTRKQTAPPPTTITTIIKDWQVTCPNPALHTKQQASCTMEPIATAYKGSNSISRFFGRMIRVKNKAVPVFVVQTPLDLLLSSGITLKVDRRRSVKMAYRSCHADGCIIPFQLSGKIKTSLQRGNQLKLFLKTLNAKTEQTSISLIGFTKALKMLETSDQHSAMPSRLHNTTMQTLN